MRRLLVFALFLCAATSCAGGASTSSVAPPTTTLHPFYEAFPELLDFDPGSEPGLACPDGGGGSQISELDLDRARERFAAEPERYATDGTEAVIRRLEAGGAGSERVAGLRTWLRHAGSSVVLPLAPDRSADQYALSASLRHVDGDFYLIASMDFCDFPFEPLPER